MRGPAGELAVDDGGGGGVPVLLIHGNGGDLSVWRHQLRHLRSRRRALALDLRGFGSSQPAADGDYSVTALADDVAAVVSGLELAPVVLAGHSIGATVAIAALDRLPNRVAGLLLVDPTGDLSRMPHQVIRSWLDLFAPQSYRQHVEDYFRRMAIGCADGVEEQVLQTLLQTPREVVVGVMESLLDFDPLPRLSAFSGPKLSIITELNDRPTSLHNLMGLDSLPHRLVTGVSHWLMLDRPQQLNTLMDDFLETVEQSRDQGVPLQ